MDSSPPVVYIFHGDDTLAIRRHVDEIVNKIGLDQSMVELNLTRLDGRQAVEDDLYAAANAMPFLADRRVVIFSYPFSRMTTDAARKRFLALLDGLPPSTALVLDLPDVIEKKDWKSFPAAIKSNWMRKWIQSAGSRAEYCLCALPSSREMPEWIRREARSQGGQFTPDAALALASHLGSDTQAAVLEIDKLLTFVDRKRPVDANDVEELTAQGGQADVFEMVDAMAAGNARQALHVLHRLLETQDPISLFAMITRQFRLLIQVRELMDAGRGGQAVSELRLHPYVAEKLTGQARRFQLAPLEEIYHQLLLIDEAGKTGQMPLDLALDTFIAGLAR